MYLVVCVTLKFCVVVGSVDIVGLVVELMIVLEVVKTYPGVLET